MLFCGTFFFVFYMQTAFLSLYGSLVQMQSVLLYLDKLFITMDFQNYLIFQTSTRISPFNPSQFFNISRPVCNASFHLMVARRVCSVPNSPRDALWNNQTLKDNLCAANTDSADFKASLKSVCNRSLF